MTAPTKTWEDFTVKYKREVVNGIADTVMSKCSTVDEVQDFLQQVVDRVERKTGNVIPRFSKQETATPMKVEQLDKVMQGLGQLREEHAHHNSQLHIPKVSIDNLDRVVLASGMSRQNLNKIGYTIGIKQYRSATSILDPAAPSSRVGRRSKVTDPECIKVVGAALQKYANDSSKVVRIRKQGIKTLVCAKLLSKSPWRIWKIESGLRSHLSWSTFRRICRIHFPHLRRPARKTDVCGHCRMLKRHLEPRAEAEYKKRRKEICKIFPQYFHELDSNQEFAALQASRTLDEMVLAARDFINQCCNRASRDPVRTHMSRADRLALHEAEARALHKLRGHCDLLNAYRWHRTTADRQKASTDKVLKNLTDSEAYFHFDFKENVRYPMSQEETGDEWHAQNKLSLTVFGCTVHTPGRKNTHFLLVSDVLDHDSQMAILLLTHILEIVRTKPAYKWEKVQMLHLVCDCGPHFRSRESYAFFLAALPTRWKVNVPLLQMFSHLAPDHQSF